MTLSPWSCALGLVMAVVLFWLVPPWLGPFRLAGYVLFVLAGCVFLTLGVIAVLRDHPGRRQP